MTTQANKTRRTWKQLLAAATKKRLRVETGEHFDLVSTGKTNRAYTLIRYPDGTIFCANTDLSVAQSMRVRDAWEFLGLPTN